MKQKVISEHTYRIYPFNPAESYNVSNFCCQLDGRGWLISSKVNNLARPIVKHLSERWNQKLPITLLDNLTHGSLGHVLFFKKEEPYGSFLDSETKRLLTSFEPTNRLIARISYSSKFTKNSPDWDFSTFANFHLSVLATKTFRPENDLTNLVCENVYFTIRWTTANSKNEILAFDDQTSEFSKGKLSFDSRRMSFYQTIKYNLKNNNDPIPLETLMSYYPIAKPEFQTLNKPIDELDFSSDEGKQFEYSDEQTYTCMDNTPIVGYAPLLQMLEQYGDVQVSDKSLFLKMSVKEGANYFISKLIPAVEQYAYSNRKTK
ncbi:MAG: hypothetical protein ACP5N2_02905 [Candidatus Nanoarchaeia archaeon]